MENEIDTKPFIKIALSEGKKVGVPICTVKGIMEVREIASLKDLKGGSYGILEPNKPAN
jgi:5-formyltetrahydrofolate cyclo-ligase